MVNYIRSAAVWLTAASAVSASVLPQVLLGPSSTDTPPTKQPITRTARFDQHKLVHISPPCAQTHSNAVYESAVLQKLSTEKTALYKTLAVDQRLDVWSVDQDGSVVVRVDPQQLQDLRDWVAAVGDWFPCTDDEEASVRSEPFRVLVDDIQPALNAESERLNKFSQLDVETQHAQWFSDYHRYDDIRTWYNSLAQQHPSLLQIIPSIGKTAENRDIFAVKITGNKTSLSSTDHKKQFWFHGLQHAREWIGGAVVQFISAHFLTGYGIDEAITTLLDSAEFVIVPVMNVDGYEYTWTNNRLWRKNRRPLNDFFGSVGVDLNRNWPEHWGEDGSSSSPYSEVYQGPSAGSEPEVQALRKFFLSPNHTSLIGAIDFHAYSQLVLRPYGWTRKDAPDEHLLKQAGDGLRDRIKEVHGKKYVSEREIDLYAASGTASDWFYGKEVTKWLEGRHLYAYTIELRPSANEGGWGGQGFILPPEQIVPTGQEIVKAVKWWAQFALDHPLKKKD
ncbi:hypothetical protein HK097_011483 [Rhizophlyctis rosea]|uniref:Peptidase M14 domain-containing protein n=1 Tax=Rhizophlyctis rosea TaxID=64517 RepID=A0AAD5SHN6_9FUNG|nr:hypothetical protein HK097_011483 [Rhizophlyctis rosea]